MIEQVWGILQRAAADAGDVEQAYRKDNLIGDNYERGMLSLVFIEGVWYYRCPRTGEDRIVAGGQSEAEAYARDYYDGLI